MNQYLGGLSRFTLSYDFGMTLDEQRTARQNALKEQVKNLIAGEFRKKESARAKEHFDAAFALYKQEKYEESLDALAKAFEWNEDYKDAKELKALIVKKMVGRYYDRGVSAYNAKNYISALENFKNVSSIDQTYKDTAAYMGRLDEKMKMKSDAKEFFSKGVEFYVNKRYDDAIEMFNKAAAVEPGNAMIRAYLGKARAQASTASGGRPLTPAQADRVRKLYYTGLKSYTDGDLNAALASWKAALEINPEDIKIMKSIEKAQAEQAELAKRGIK
jgi:tetratricopeptide (TPR) repeat protein